MNKERYEVIGLADGDGFTYAVLYHPKMGMPYVVAKLALQVEAEFYVEAANERLEKKP